MGNLHTSKKLAYRFSVDMFYQPNGWSAEITNTNKDFKTAGLPDRLQDYAKGLEEVAQHMRQQVAVMQGVKIWKREPD